MPQQDSLSCVFGISSLLGGLDEVAFDDDDEVAYLAGLQPLQRLW
jgi:hypothetical protein